MKSRVKLIVAAAAILGASSIATWHVVRDRMTHVGEWNDVNGARFGLEDAAVRHAVFGAPETLSGEINSAADERRATRSIDGRHLVFEVGSRGENTELWIGECVGDRVRSLRLLSEIDTTADECAPSFAADSLWFSSDRAGGAGGLDLYRASFDGTAFGAVERLPDTLQSPRDDTDPTPVLATSAIAFASDRSGSFALYRTEADGPDRTPVRIAGLPDGAREPSFSGDGRSLWFALEQRGSFDIHRALRSRDGFVDTGAVPGLDTTEDERAPLALGDGFELLFARSGPETRGFDLARVRAGEVLRVPASRWTVFEIATIAALLLLALMAFLSDRWPALDTLYRCYLASVLIHLVLALWFQHVYVEGGTPSASDTGGRIRVKLAPTASSLSRASRERAGDVGDIATARETQVTLEKADVSQPLDQTSLSATTLAIAELLPALESAPSAPARDVELAAARPTRSSDERLNDAEQRVRALAAPATGLEIEVSLLANAPREAALKLPSRSEFGAVVTPERESRPTPMNVESPVVSLAAPTAARESSPRTKRLESERLLDGEILRTRDTTRTSDDASNDSGAKWLAELGASGAQPDTKETPEQARFTPTAQDQTTGGIGATIAAPRVEIPAPRVEISAPKVERSFAVQLGRPGIGSPGLRDREAVAATAPRTQGNSLEHDLLGDMKMPAAPAAAVSAPERLQLAPEVRDDTQPTTNLEALTATPLEEKPPEPPPARTDWAGTPYKNRVGNAKERALEDHGGSAETERAVQLGLEYLASIQSRDGHFGPARARDPKYGQVAIGKTGLALLAFLGAGHTPQSTTEFSNNTERALQFLVEAQHDTGGHIGDGDAYSHGIATYALAEAYALTKEARWREPLERAVARIIAAQSRSKDARLFGGWGYFFADGHSFDRWSRTSITAWQVMALESARLGGLSIEPRVFEDATQFLEGSRDTEADYVRYSHDPARLASDYPTLPASTPAALFALSIMGRPVDTSEYAAEKRFVLERAPRGFRFTSEGDFVRRGQGNPYFHYYGTLALFRVGGGAWKTWNEALKRSLLPAQNTDGSWTPIDVYARYGRDDEEDKSYTTALCVLSLEIYYRYYLPLLKAGEPR